MSKKISKFKININKSLYNFINLEVLPGTNIDENNFWKGFSDLINDLLPINEKPLKKRENVHNRIDPKYKPIAHSSNNIAFQTACDLIFKGIVQPSGYTEPILHKRRTEFKNC